MSYIGNTPTNQNFVAGADQFSGTGSQTVFTLSRNVNTVFDIFITVSNVPQDPFTAYTVSGNTLTFDSAPPSGTNNIDVVYRATNTQQFVPSQKSVGLSQLSASGTASSGTFLRGDNTWASAGFSSGTLMLFQQTAAPTGWTKQTTHDNKALRVVSGAASSGGSVAFTTAFANGSTGATTLSTSQIPSHNHTVNGSDSIGTGSTQQRSGGTANVTSSSTGGGGSHDHSLSLAVQYVDLIIASKD